MSDNDKYKVWIDYIVEIIDLNIRLGYYKENRMWYVKTFDEFCKGDDARVSNCLIGWSWRFEDRIFK